MTGVAKSFWRGCHRVCSPAATWQRIEPLLERAGITRVADVTGLDGIGLPVYQAVRPRSRNLSVSQGKGATPEAARVSAAMEALELWHAEDLGHLPAVTMTAAAMGYANAVPAAALPWLVSDHHAAHEPLAWVRARSLTTGRSGWLPRAMLELDFSHSLAGAPQPFRLTSSGLAAGNCSEEALVHALCELIERHEMARAFGSPPTAAAAAPRPLDPTSAGDGDCVALAAAIAAAGMKLAVHDVSGELGVAVVAAEIAADDLPLAFRGSGCHPSPAVALSRALAEAAQSRLTYVSGARDDVQLAGGEEPWAAFDRFVVPASGAALATLPDLATPSVAGDLAVLLERLAGHGYEPFVVDLTRREIAVPVVRVVVPGLLEMRDHA